jgi:hypothetical protein
MEDTGVGIYRKLQRINYYRGIVGFGVLAHRSFKGFRDSAVDDRLGY